MNRRQFLQTAALAASTVPPTTGVAESSRPAGKPKVGCLSWCFHSLTAGADPEPALDIIGELGFDGVELIASARRDLTDFWTDAKIELVNQRLQRNKLRVSQFVLFQPVVENLSSTKATSANGPSIPSGRAAESARNWARPWSTLSLPGPAS
jgi:hypothetical protein